MENLKNSILSYLRENCSSSSALKFFIDRSFKYWRLYYYVINFDFGFERDPSKYASRASSKSSNYLTYYGVIFGSWRNIGAREQKVPVRFLTKILNFFFDQYSWQDEKLT